MGEHDLTNIIFDCTTPCGAVLTSATDALVDGADATAVVCLVRETINGRNKTDRAALFQGQGSPGTTFNATRALCTVLDWEADYYAPDVLIFEAVGKYEQSYALEEEISFSGTADDKALNLSCIVLFREGTRGGTGHYQIIRKADNQWCLFDDCSLERTAGKWSRQPDG